MTDVARLFWTLVSGLVGALVVAVLWSAIRDDQRRRTMARAYDKYRNPDADQDDPDA